MRGWSDRTADPTGATALTFAGSILLADKIDDVTSLLLLVPLGVSTWTIDRSRRWSPSASWLTALFSAGAVVFGLTVSLRGRTLPRLRGRAGQFLAGASSLLRVRRLAPALAAGALAWLAEAAALASRAGLVIRRIRHPLPWNRVLLFEHPPLESGETTGYSDRRRASSRKKLLRSDRF